MLSEAKHLFQIPSCFGFPLVIVFIYDSMLGFFLQGGQGDYLRSVPLPPFDPQPLHALQLIVLRTDYVNAPQRMRQRYAYGSNIAAVRCGWENRIVDKDEN